MTSGLRMTYEQLQAAVEARSQTIYLSEHVKLEMYPNRVEYALFVYRRPIEPHVPFLALLPCGNAPKWDYVTTFEVENVMSDVDRFIQARKVTP